MIAKAAIDFPQPDSPTTPKLFPLSSLKFRLSKMLIGPDWCSVRTVKLLTVNKFKWLLLDVCIFVKCENFQKMRNCMLQRKAAKLFFWMASFLESLSYHGSFCIQKLTILCNLLFIITEKCKFISNLMIVDRYLYAHFTR
jgi:hypothetical protein